MALDVGTLRAVLSLDDQMSSGLTRAGAKLQSFGRDLSTYISLPLAAASVAALKFSTDFESALVKLSTIAGESAGNISHIKDEILKMGPAVGQGPKALADAMLAIESTGINGAEALDILQQSAKAATTGLGDTKDVARAVTAAITAYGQSNLDAKTATDVLFQAVKDGGAEADEFAGTLGRVVGLAANVGVSFQETAGFIATFTRLGVDASEATTALRGVLTTVIKPSHDAREQLKQLGTSVDELRQSIKEKGLTQTLIDLVKATEGNEDAIAAIVPNVRALSGVMGTAGVQAEQMKQILDRVTNSAGVLDKAFDETTKTGAFKWSQFTVQLQITATKFGDVLAPAAYAALQQLQPLLDVVGNLATAFQSLPAPVQASGLALTGLLAAIGPLTYAIGSLIKAAGSINEALTFVSASASLGTLAIGLTGVGAAALYAFDQVGKYKRQMDEAAKSAEDNAKLLKAFNDLYGSTSIDVSKLSDEQKQKVLALAKQKETSNIAGLGLGRIHVQLPGTYAPTTPQQEQVDRAAVQTKQQLAQAARDHAEWVKVEADEVIRLNAALIDEITRMQGMVTHSFVTTQALEGFAKSMIEMRQQLTLPHYGDQISVAEHNLSVTMGKNALPDALKNATKYMPRITLPPPPKSEVDQWESSLKSVSNGFEQLAQISDGSMSEVTRAIGTAVSATEQLVESWNTMHKEGATTADKIGGSVQAIGAGVQISKSLGGGVKGGAAGGALAGAEIGSIIPGIGTAFGAAIGAGVGAMVSAFASKGRDLVKQFADTEGGFDALHQKLLAIGDDGEELWTKLTQGVGSNNPKQAQAAIDEVSKALDDFDKHQQDVADQFTKLEDAVKSFGGVAPKELQPYIQSLLQMNGLTDDQRQLLESLAGDPSMDQLQAAADRLGVTFDHMGQKFQQTQIGQQGNQMADDIQTLVDAGADLNGVLGDASDKLVALADQAMETGVALPDTLKPYYQGLIDLGKLTAPDGTLVTNIDQLSFAKIKDDTLETIKMILQDIDDLLRNQIPQAAKYSQDALDKVHAPAGVSPGDNYVRVGGQWVNYGSPEAADNARMSQNKNAAAGQGGVPQMASGGYFRVTTPTLFRAGEAGPEDVAFSGSGKSFNDMTGGGGGGTAILQVDGYTLAEVLVPPFADAVRRYNVVR